MSLELIEAPQVSDENIFKSIQQQRIIFNKASVRAAYLCMTSIKNSLGLLTLVLIVHDHPQTPPDLYSVRLQSATVAVSLQSMCTSTGSTALRIDSVSAPAVQTKNTEEPFHNAHAASGILFGAKMVNVFLCIGGVPLRCCMPPCTSQIALIQTHTVEVVMI